MKMLSQTGSFLHLRWSSLAMVTLVVSACAPTRGPAPIESRTVSAAKTPDQRSANGKSLLDLPAVPEGSYRVKRGDTLVGIALEFGVDWRELVTWNKLDNPNLIEVGQVLIVRLPQASAPVQATPQTSAVAGRPAIDVRPLDQSATESAATSPADPAAAPKSGPVAGLNWSWPANGQVISNFSEAGSKGILIAGAPGESIFAAEQGRVVYSGNGLRGYGNLVIVKHDGDFLTAYAHNRAILVKEGQVVRRGQKIAELGMSDADRPMLHFEVRVGGKPVDPLAYLPRR